MPVAYSGMEKHKNEDNSCVRMEFNNQISLARWNIR